MGEGYRYDPVALTQIDQKMADGARELDAAAAAAIEAPDAGVSSSVVANALGQVLRGMTAGAELMSDTATKVNSGAGWYDDIENTNEGAIKARGQVGIGPGSMLPSDNVPAVGSMPPPPSQPPPPPPPAPERHGPGGPGSMDDK